MEPKSSPASFASFPSATTYLTFSVQDKNCCRCLPINIGILILGFWSIIATVGYYIGFLLLSTQSSSYPTAFLYIMATFGLVGGATGIFAGIFEWILFAKVFLIWAIVHFFGQLAEGIVYAAIYSSPFYILFFIDFVVWGYFVIIITQYIEVLKTRQRRHNKVPSEINQARRVMPSYYSIGQFSPYTPYSPVSNFGKIPHATP